MTSEPFESRLDETLRLAGLPPADHQRVNQMADQIASVDRVVGQWDSPGLYDIAGAWRKCLAVLKAHHFTGTDNLTHHTASWDFIGDDPVNLPAFDPDDPAQASVPRVIFAAHPHSVRICRGTVHDTLTGVLLNIAAKPGWRCDWSGHQITPEVWTDPDTGKREVVHSKPYCLTKANGDFLLLFVVCTQCLEDLITRGRESFDSSANDRDRESIDGRWQPIYRNPRPSSRFEGLTQWDSNEHPNGQIPAAYLLNGIRIVIPHRHSSWREDDTRTYDNLPY